MEYLRLRTTLGKNKLYFFSLQDLKNLFPGERPKTLKNNLTRWVQKEYLVRIKRDMYQWTESCGVDEISDLYVANRLYEPSYISLETALSFYSIIPDIAVHVTSVTSRQTRIFRNQYGTFFYRSCHPRALIGYRLMAQGGFKIRIADPEKALVDFLYFRLREGPPLDFEKERFNKRILTKFRWARALGYANLFNQRTVKTVHQLGEFLGLRCSA